LTKLFEITKSLPPNVIPLYPTFIISLFLIRFLLPFIATALDDQDRLYTIRSNIPISETLFDSITKSSVSDFIPQYIEPEILLLEIILDPPPRL